MNVSVYVIIVRLQNLFGAVQLILQFLIELPVEADALPPEFRGARSRQCELKVIFQIDQVLVNQLFLLIIRHFRKLQHLQCFIDAVGIDAVDIVRILNA